MGPSVEGFQKSIYFYTGGPIKQLVPEYKTALTIEKGKSTKPRTGRQNAEVEERIGRAGGMS